MTKRRFILLALLIGVFAFLAAGCGGDDNEAGGSRHDRGRGQQRLRQHQRPGGVDRRRGRGLPGRPRRLHRGEPGRQGRLQVGSGAGDRALDVGRGRQPARHRRPAAAGLHDGLRPARRAEADRLRGGRDQGGFLAVVARPRHGRREALRPLFQGRQQVDHLVQRPRFQGRRRRARGELGRLPQGRRHDRGVRRPALLDRRRRRLDPHRPVREHLPPPGRPGEVRPADEARDSLDRSVGDRRADADGQAAPVRQDRRRHLERAPDRLPDLGDAGLRRRRRRRRRSSRATSSAPTSPPRPRRSRRPTTTSTPSRRSTTRGRW